MLGKVTLTLEKTTAIAALGLVIAMCAAVMLKNGIEKIISGNGQHDSYTRTKGIILVTLASVIFIIGVGTILESDLVLKLLSKRMKLLLASFY